MYRRSVFPASQSVQALAGLTVSQIQPASVQRSVPPLIIVGSELLPPGQLCERADWRRIEKNPEIREGDQPQPVPEPSPHKHQIPDYTKIPDYNMGGIEQSIVNGVTVITP